MKTNKKKIRGLWTLSSCLRTWLAGQHGRIRTSTTNVQSDGGHNKDELEKSAITRSACEENDCI